MFGIAREHGQDTKVLAALCGTAGERSCGNEVQLQRNETRAVAARLPCKGPLLAERELGTPSLEK